jgi:4-amino-4-deoxy-L-arabinose transferase-like glycosyltransferase
MKKSPEFYPTLPFYLFIAGLFLIIVSKDLLSNGMFLDGLIYSTVSKNLADGIGTFWNPHFTATFLSEFHEHPPLAFEIQSMFYRLLGESRYIDKLYSLLTVIIVGYVILRIWKSIGYKNGWIPLFIWILTPTVFWASYNNLLENTLTIFISLSVLFYLIYQKNSNYFFIILAGMILSLGFLTKGFVAFFPWTFPVLYWLFFRQKAFGKMAIDSIGIIVFTLIPLILLVLFIPDAGPSLKTYIDNQVINSLKNIVTVNSRFDIVKRLLNELILPAGLCLLFGIWGRIRKTPGAFLHENNSKSLLFASFGLTGVLPIMISLKQSGFYIVPTYPFFAIATSIFIYPYVDYLITRLNFESKAFKVFKWIAYGLFTAGIILSLCFSNRYSRDKDKIKDVYSILPEIPQGSIINISPEIFDDWSLHAYFARFKNISLDPEPANKREYLLIKNEFYADTLNSEYTKIKINTKYYQLFKRK